MKVKKYQASEERTILMAMIVHTQVLDRIVRHLGESKPFNSKWSNLIAKWCMDHHRKYGRAPRRSIETYFSRFAQGTKDQDTVDVVETFLGGLSDDYKGAAKETNVEYVVDLASAYFRKVRLEQTLRGVEAALELNDPESAEASVMGYRKVEFSSKDWLNPFDDEVIKRALEKKEDQVLIRFPGALGEFVNQFFERDSFISFAGPEKRGKSYWLNEVVWQAVRQRRRVLYYITGDMSERQMMRRLLVRAARRPLSAGTYRKPKRIKVKDGKVRVLSEEIVFKELTAAAASKAMQEVLAKTATKQSRLRIKVLESSTLAASDIERDIEELAKTEDWVPDVVVVDYADILLAEPHSKSFDYRHQINETWKVMRRISQKFHLLFVTATQTAATSYDSPRIKKGDFSEDKRKAAHVTGMLGINQTSDEKLQGVYRLNWVVLRDGIWTDSQEVTCAGNLALACPCIISTL